MDRMSPRAPAALDCQVIELRQYTLRPTQRDVLIGLFDRELVEPQEAVGIRVIGQFRDLDDPDRFVWLRGFADMASRAEGLSAFYGGPVWATHRATANATMVDSDNVLLLRPAWAGAVSRSIEGDRAMADSTATSPGLLVATVLPLRAPAPPELLDLARGPLSEALRRAGADVLACYVTEPAANNFPRLPVREGEHVLVSLAMFKDFATFSAWSNGDSWQKDMLPALLPWLTGAAQTLRLAPTARSALHA